MTLKDYRISLGITISEASASTGVPLRTYNRYEQDESYGDSIKRKAIYDMLALKYEITEEKGLLSIEKIRLTVTNVLNKYKDAVEYCYLFGSYAKGYASEVSDVDLCVSTTLTGLKFIGLIEELRLALHKKVDLIRVNDMKDNIELIREIMKNGMKIY